LLAAKKFESCMAIGCFAPLNRSFGRDFETPESGLGIAIVPAIFPAPIASTLIAEAA